jgi:hypothetical protein
LESRNDLLHLSIGATKSDGQSRLFAENHPLKKKHFHNANTTKHDVTGPNMNIFRRRVRYRSVLRFAIALLYAHFVGMRNMPTQCTRRWRRRTTG